MALRSVASIAGVCWLLTCTTVAGQAVSSIAEDNCTCADWKELSRSSCSVTCGTGSQTVETECHLDNTTLNTNCSSVIGDTATMTELCNIASCPHMTLTTSMTSPTSPTSMTSPTTPSLTTCSCSDKDVSLSWTTAGISIAAIALIAFLLGAVITGLWCRQRHRKAVSRNYLNGGGEQFVNMAAASSHGVTVNSARRDWTAEEEDGPSPSRRRFSKEASHDVRRELFEADTVHIPLTIQEDKTQARRPEAKPRRVDS